MNYMGGRMSCEQCARVIEAALKDEFDRSYYTGGGKLKPKSARGFLKQEVATVMQQLASKLEDRYTHTNGLPVSSSEGKNPEVEGI